MPDTNPTPKVVIKELSGKIQADLLALRNKAVNYALDHGMAVTDAIIEKHSDAVVVVKEIVDLITEKRGPRTTPQAPPKPAPAPAPEPSKS